MYLFLWPFNPKI